MSTWTIGTFYGLLIRISVILHTILTLKIFDLSTLLLLMIMLKLMECQEFTSHIVSRQTWQSTLHGFSVWSYLNLSVYVSWARYFLIIILQLIQHRWIEIHGTWLAIVIRKEKKNNEQNTRNFVWAVRMRWMSLVIVSYVWSYIYSCAFAHTNAYHTCLLYVICNQYRL